MPDFTVRYADFKGGDFGLRDPAKADADTYDALNLYPYDSGLLGVRAGVKQLPITGLPTHTNVPGPLGFFASGPSLIIHLGRPYSMAMAGGAATAWAPMSPVPTGPVRFIVGNGIVYALTGGRLYKYTNPTTVVEVTLPAPLSFIVRWGYYFVGIDRDRPWRIWFSLVDSTGPNFDSWPANNYIDVGNTEAITALNPIYNLLYAGKRDGWWAISGVLGTLASVRDVVIGNGPVDPRFTSVTTDNRIIYWPVQSAPAWFNGERVYIDTAQEMAPRELPFMCDAVIVTPTGRRLILAGKRPDGTHIRTWGDSAWTHHTLPVNLGGLVPNEVRDGDQMPEGVIYGVLAPTTLGDPVIVASYNHQLGRPAHTSDTYAAPIDHGATALVSGSIRFPTYWEPIGRQVRVRSVIVQFRRWASGVAGALNQIALRVNAQGRYAGGVQVGALHHWDEPCERSSTSGTDDSWRINLGEQGWGNGFQIEMTQLAGVALREIIVLCDVRNERM